ncbi:hypothetical protein [Chryseobacterium turcicum]|nr:hypothetical protein [Chryseobacterium turcicum]
MKLLQIIHIFYEHPQSLSQPDLLELNFLGEKFFLINLYKE